MSDAEALRLAAEVLEAVASGRHRYDRMFGIAEIEMRGDVSTLKARARKAAQALRSLALKRRAPPSATDKSGDGGCSPWAAGEERALPCPVCDDGIEDRCPRCGREP